MVVFQFFNFQTYAKMKISAQNVGSRNLFWTLCHGRVTATLISHAIQGELKIDLYILACRIKLLPSINLRYALLLYAHSVPHTDPDLKI